MSLKQLRIVPIVHYLRENERTKGNLIHTVVDDPIRIDDLSEHQALDYVRDIFSTWYYLMMEAYGKSTRNEILGALLVVEVWKRQVEERIGAVARWDNEIESKSDYRQKGKILPEQVFQVIAGIKNITPQNIEHILYAEQLMAQCRQEDFQHYS